MADKVHFVGIAGTGMSPLAAFCIEKGMMVSGSDRFLESEDTILPILEQLRSMGVELCRQDGDWIRKHRPDCVVFSTAIESDNPDLVAANEENISTQHRAEYLAGFFNECRGIAISGTSGKTSITGLLGHIFMVHSLSPDLFCGDRVLGLSSSFLEGRGAVGNGEFFISEVDESDGSIVHFNPEIGIISNISKDHKEEDELRDLFRTFVDHIKKCCITDKRVIQKLSLNALDSKIKTAGLMPENDFYPEKINSDREGSSFIWQGIDMRLNHPGEYNLMNAVYALSVCEILGLDRNKTAEGLKTFQGIRRRFELIGEKNGVRVFDDFAHNPDKISACLSMTRNFRCRRILIFQPHGYWPLKFLFDGFVEAFFKTYGGERPTHSSSCIRCRRYHRSEYFIQ